MLQLSTRLPWPRFSHHAARTLQPAVLAPQHQRRRTQSKHHYAKSSAMTSEPRRRQRGYVPIGVATLDIKKTSWRERDSRTASARGQVVGRRGEGGWEESERASEQGRQPLKIGQPHGNRPHENNAGPACREPRVVINLSHPRAGSNGGVGAHTCRPPCCLRARSRPPASPVPPYPPQHIPGALESGRDLVGIRGLKHPRHLRSVVAGHVRSCSLHLRDTPQMNTHPGILARRAPAPGRSERARDRSPVCAAGAGSTRRRSDARAALLTHLGQQAQHFDAILHVARASKRRTRVISGRAGAVGTRPTPRACPLAARATGVLRGRCCVRRLQSLCSAGRWTVQSVVGALL